MNPVVHRQLFATLIVLILVFIFGSTVSANEGTGNRTWHMTDSGIGHNIGRLDGDGWSANVHQDQPGMLSFGPYVTGVVSGTWNVTWSMMVDNNTTNSLHVARLEVFDPDSGELLAAQDIQRTRFTQAMKYEDFNLHFTTLQTSQRLEFRVFWYGQAYIKLKQVSIQPVTSVKAVHNWAAEPMGHNTGRSESGGWSATPLQDQPGFLSYGPYVSGLELEKWTVEWSLLARDMPSSQTKVVRIEIVDAAAGGQLLAVRDIRGKEFVVANQLQTFKLDFMNTNPDHQLEFRVHWYGDTYVRLQRIAAYSTKSVETEKKWSMTDPGIGHNIGRLDGDGWSANVQQDQPGMLSFGPYVTGLSPGTWNVTWSMMVDNNTANSFNMVRLEVFDPDSGELLAAQDIQRTQFTQAMKYEDFNLHFTTLRPSHRLEFRTYWYGGAYIKLKQLSVQPAASAVEIHTWAAEPMGHNTGRSENGGWSATPSQDQPGFLSYGPYISGLGLGRGTVEWSLMSGDTVSPQTKVVRLEVVDAAAEGKLLAVRDITRQEFATANHLQNFRLDFMNTNPDHRLEFRVYWYGETYTRLHRIAAYRSKTFESEKIWGMTDPELGHIIGRPDGDGWSANVTEDQPGMLSYGPYVKGLSPGTWNATWTMMIDNNTFNSFHMVRLEVSDYDSGELLAVQNIQRTQFTQAAEYEDFSLQFTTVRPSNRLEFRVYWYGGAYVKLKQIAIQPVAWATEVQHWSAEAMGHDTGQGENGGWSATPAQDQPGFLSYGPHVSGLGLGRGTVEWSLVAGGAVAPQTKVVRLEVVDAAAGGQLLAVRELTRQEFVGVSQPQTFKLDFMNTNPDHQLEFRVHWYGESYVRLDKILFYQVSGNEQVSVYHPNNSLHSITANDGRQLYFEYDQNGNLMRRMFK